MLEQYLGEEAFRAGIAAYLRRHAYGTTETTDLWDALEEVTGEPVRRIMDSWIFRGGHPVVRVEHDGDTLRLDQGPASYDGTDGDEQWPIPMVLSVGTDGASPTRQRLLLDPATSVDAAGPPKFVQANVGGAGFYRVELDRDLRIALLDHGDPDPLERFVLLDDTWTGFIAGRVPLVDAADTLVRLAQGESDPSVWRRLSGAGRELARLAGPDHRDTTTRMIASFAVPALARLEHAIASDASDDRAREVRGVLFTLAGTDGGDAQVRARARALVQDLPDDPSLRAAAISVLAADATAAEHAELERRWRDASTPQDELRYLNALVDTDDPALFDRTLELAATEVRTQNAPYLLRRAIDHPSLGRLAWELISERWAELAERFPSNSLPRMLEGIRGITDADLAHSIEAFLHEHPLPSGERQVAQHQERMWVTVAAARRTRADLDRSPGMLGHVTT